jgi:hypothetical protein
MSGQAMSGGDGGWIPTHSQPGARRWLEANTTLQPHYPQKNLVPIVPVAGWVVGLVWIAGKSLPPPEFNTQTFQPVVSHYIDYTTPATIEMSTNLKFAWRGREKNEKVSQDISRPHSDLNKHLLDASLEQYHYTNLLRF